MSVIDDARGAIAQLAGCGDASWRAVYVAGMIARLMRDNPGDREALCIMAEAAIVRWLPDCPARREAFLLLAQPQRPPMPRIVDNPSPVDHRAQSDTLGAERIVGATKAVRGDERVTHPDPQTTIELDPELARVAVALGLSLPLLAWAAARRADTVGCGIVTVDQVVSALRAAGGKADAKTARRWLRAGAGVFFHAQGSNIRLCSYARVTGQITARALAQGRRDLVSTNPPGVPYVSLPVATSKAAWNARIYAAWHNSRADHTRQISRFTLSRLWGVTRAQLIKWEKLAGVKALRSYALHTTEGSDIPEYAEPVLTKRGTIQWRTRHSNSYNAPSYRIKHHRKIVRSARRVARSLTNDESIDLNPAGNYGLNAATSGAKGGALTVTGRLVFFDQQGAHQAAKRLQHHYASTVDDGRRHYIELGRDRYGNVILEQSRDGQQRCAVDDITGRDKADAYFAATGGRAAWRAYVRGAL